MPVRSSATGDLLLSDEHGGQFQVGRADDREGVGQPPLPLLLALVNVSPAALEPLLQVPGDGAPIDGQVMSPQVADLLQAALVPRLEAPPVLLDPLLQAYQPGLTVDSHVLPGGGNCLGQLTVD